MGRKLNIIVFKSLYEILISNWILLLIYVVGKKIEKYFRNFYDFVSFYSYSNMGMSRIFT